MKTPTSNNAPKSWWPGDSAVEPFMDEVRKAISRHHVKGSPEYVDIYNRCYEAVYSALGQKETAIKAQLEDEK